MAKSDHEFGGVSTGLKLSLVEGYLRAFTTALRGRFRELWYIDAFAGTGERTVKHAAREGDLFDADTPERVERHKGSARIAIDVQPPFDRLIFIDNEPRHCVALRELAASHPGRRIEIVEADANDAIMALVKCQSWQDSRAVMFLDPYGKSVAWETLRAVQATCAIDVWYLASLSGLFRQAARQGGKVDESKRAALTRMLGTSAWEAAWYQRKTMRDLFGDADEQNARVADVEAMERFLTDRLSTVFPKVLPPLRLKTDRNVPQFALFFAISNPHPKAIGLAEKIAGHILNSGRSSHVRPR